MTPKSAMIFCAGFGTRMGNLTKKLPKPMLPLGGRPMVDYTIDIVRDAGIGRIFANTHHLANKIEPHLAEQNVVTLREDPILETGGGLRAALGELGSDPILTINPDASWDGPNPIKILSEAWTEDMQALLLLTSVSENSSGDFSLEHGVIHRNGPYRYTGAQILKTDQLYRIPEDAFSLNTYWDHLQKTGPLHGVIYPGTWWDIGTKEALAAANARMAD